MDKGYIREQQQSPCQLRYQPQQKFGDLELDFMGSEWFGSEAVFKDHLVKFPWSNTFSDKQDASLILFIKQPRGLTFYITSVSFTSW